MCLMCFSCYPAHAVIATTRHVVLAEQQFPYWDNKLPPDLLFISVFMILIFIW